MPFATIACHVFAIDGYVDDATAGQVNTSYVDAAGAPASVANNDTARTAALLALVNAARQSPSVAPAQDITIYGGFRRKQSAPEHMWIEHNGVIYETMPGRGLCRSPANDKSRKCPALENDCEWSVAQVASTLTLAQFANLGTAQDC